MPSLEVVRFCAEECERQRSGELSVYNMVDAWEFAQTCSEFGFKDRISTKVTIDFITALGKMVEPGKNEKGIRTQPIYVGDGYTMIEKAPWEEVPRLLDLLLESYYDGDLEPAHKKAITKEDQFYFEYENIHPFVDGNGRTGKILYNYLNGTLGHPVMPPNFWRSSNP